MAIPIAILYLYFSLLKNYSIAITLLLLTGFLDVLDGEVARLKGKAKPTGALLDSTIDRVLDGLYVLGLALLGLDYVLAFLLLIISYGVSYVRARAESLNVKLEGVGVVERSERIIGFSIIIFLLSVSYELAYVSTIILLFLSVLTFIVRVSHAYRVLASKL